MRAPGEHGGRGRTAEKPAPHRERSVKSWTTWVSTDEAHRRAAGRRRHNRQRQAAAQARRDQVRALVQRWGLTPATRVKLARMFRVSRSTIDRDLKALADAPPLPPVCPTCGLPTSLTADPAALLERLDDAQAAREMFMS